MYIGTQKKRQKNKDKYKMAQLSMSIKAQRQINSRLNLSQ